MSDNPFRTRQRTWASDPGVHPDTDSPTLEDDWEPNGRWTVVGITMCCEGETSVVKFGWVQELRPTTP